MNTNERVSYFSKLLNEGENVISDLEKAIKAFKDYKNKYKELSKYYESDDLNADLDAEKNGLLDKSTNVGVLGEDYTYNLLIDYEYYDKFVKKLK